MRALIRTLRPHQWVKNLFVAAALVFSRHLERPARTSLRTAVAIFAFCAAVRRGLRVQRRPRRRGRPPAPDEEAPADRVGRAERARGADLGGRARAVRRCSAALALSLAARGDRAPRTSSRTCSTASKLKHVAFVDVGADRERLHPARARRRRRDRRARRRAGCSCAPRCSRCSSASASARTSWRGPSAPAGRRATRAALAGYRHPGRPGRDARARRR